MPSDQIMTTCDICDHEIPEDSTTSYTDGVACEECAGDIYPCDWCNDAYHLSQMNDIRGQSVCRRCERNAYTCSLCNEPTPTNEGNRRSVVCYDCRNNAVPCHGCGYYVYTDDAHYLECEDSYYCHGCYEDINVCARCDEVRSDGEYRECDGAWYCRSCYDEYGEEDIARGTVTGAFAGGSCDNMSPTVAVGPTVRNDGHIHSWGTKPRPVYFPSYDPKKLYFGVEMEVNCPQDVRVEDGAYLFKELNTKNLFYTKSDSSIGHGFEIVSHPMEWRWMVENPDWMDPITKLKDHKFRAYYGYNCGMHVHMSKAAFTPLSIKKIKDYFAMAGVDFLIAYGRKKRSNLMSYSRPETGKGFWFKQIRHREYRILNGRNALVTKNLKCLSWNADRFVAFNITDFTCEHRWFRATLSTRAINWNLELVHALWSVSRTVPKITHANLYEHLKKYKKHYPNAFGRFETLKETTNLFGGAF